MGKRYRDMNLSEVRAELAQIAREDRRSAEEHEHCSTDRDDGPCGHFGSSFARGINYCNLRDREQELERKESWSSDYCQNDSDWHD